jgi:hypothetical protein
VKLLGEMAIDGAKRGRFPIDLTTHQVGDEAATDEEAYECFCCEWLVDTDVYMESSDNFVSKKGHPLDFILLTFSLISDFFFVSFCGFPTAFNFSLINPLSGKVSTSNF